MADELLLLLTLLTGGYLIGSIPFGAILARLKGVDLRASGSGNVGATNVGRVLGPNWGLLCFVLDAAKGFAPVLATGLVLRGREAQAVLSPGAQALWIAAALGCILGHVFSVWLRFRGGKGVATSLGVVMGIYPYFTWAGLAAFALWIAVTWTSRYVSLGSVVAAGAFVPVAAGLGYLLVGPDVAGLWPLGMFAAAMVALILIRHRTNIRRLLAGTENKTRWGRGAADG
ncbi:MAG: glycerol-3-phosphate 1-O-acyltransferase PlsY [Planctomycetota bacterium]|nr:glycerol-3-phosphate 1-O-acyltransferase PlsY [Planctomycetota bacterium]